MSERRISRARKHTRSVGTLEARRKKSARIRTYIFLTLFFGVAVLIIVGLWQPAVRIQTIETKDQAFDSLIQEEISGTYALLIPRDSIFFFPEQNITSRILAENLTVKEIDIRRTAFNTISTKSVLREKKYVWCENEEACFAVDEAGLIFKETEKEGTVLFASSTPAYAESPLGGFVSYIVQAQSAFGFIEKLKSINIPVASVLVSENEITLTLLSETKLLYVIGNEEETFSNIKTIMQNYALLDGSIEYVDLRFGERVYLKRI